MRLLKAIFILPTVVLYLILSALILAAWGLAALITWPCRLWARHKKGAPPGNPDGAHLTLV